MFLLNHLHEYTSQPLSIKSLATPPFCKFLLLFKLIQAGRGASVLRYFQVSPEMLLCVRFWTDMNRFCASLCQIKFAFLAHYLKVEGSWLVFLAGF